MLENEGILTISVGVITGVVQEPVILSVVTEDGTAGGMPIFYFWF